MIRQFFIYCLLGIILTACSFRLCDDISKRTTAKAKLEDIDTIETQCPLKKPELKLWFPICDINGDCKGGPYYEDALLYLNQGGEFKQLEEKLGGQFIDLTGDGMEEYAWRDTYAVFVFGCKNGYFEKIIEVLPIHNGPIIEFIDDLNGNGIPEIYLSFYGGYYFHTLQILEWNGEKFESLIQIPQDDFVMDTLVTTGWDYSVKDINHDQIQEIVVINSSPIRLDKALELDDYELFDRKETITLGWNGNNYVIVKIEPYTPPIQH
jgi:hypothetical protein